VDAWAEQLPEALTPEQLVSVLETAFMALWMRTQRTLGEVTVLAIVDRVLHDVAGHFPLPGALHNEEGIEVRFGASRRRVTRRDARQLRDAIRALLTRFLTVIGDLTAEIMTPALHQALADAKVSHP
jgi:hypothetical protein